MYFMNKSHSLLVMRTILAALCIVYDLKMYVFCSPTGSSSHTYIRGSFTYQLAKELENIRNQKNKLGKHFYSTISLMYFILKPDLNYHINVRQRRFF